MLRRVAAFSFRHRRLVLAGWLIAVVLAFVGGPALAGKTVSSGRLPGTDSQHAYDALARSFPREHGLEAHIVFADPNRNGPAINAYLTDVSRVPGVLQVAPMLRSPDGRVAAAPITVSSATNVHPHQVGQEIMREARPFEANGMHVAFSGDPFGNFKMPASEVVGILAAVIVLLIAFGSLIAMGVPITTALVGIGVSLAGVGVVAHFFTTPDFAAQVASMIGIGVGIDYALFIVTRYRDALHRTGSPESAVMEAMTTSGRAVVFAAFTVMVSVLGMFLMGIPFLDGLAVGVSVSVAIAVFAAVTLLPAMLGFVGFGIDRFRMPHKTRQGETFWHRWARTVARRPRAIAAIGFAMLVLLALPALHMRMGQPDASNDPKSATTRQAYDLIASGWGKGANGPILVVGEGDRHYLSELMPEVVAKMRHTPGVAAVTDPQFATHGTAAVATLIPTTGPQTAQTASLVHRLRDHVIPEFVNGTGVEVHLGGETASAIDSADVISHRLPIFILAVLVLSFILLLAVFRSLLVPLKAVLMNLLSIGAAYGIVVAAFQWGWGSQLLGVHAAPIEPWVPMMLFAIVFGLSMDYEVFLLSAIREHYDRTHDNSTAVAEGLADTARVITAAALIMVCVFGSFVAASSRDLKVIGLGLAVAVALDATIVRVVLVPATMELLGDANWWLPRWLGRIVPHVHVESADTAVVASLPARDNTDERELVA
jgi:RND superfamily putative drug exporter